MPTEPDASLRTASTPSRGAQLSLALPAFAITGALVATWGVFNADKLVATGFERALASMEQPAPSLMRHAPARPLDGVAGTEEFWLRSPGGSGIVKTVAVGQQITLAQGGVAQQWTVTEIRAADDAVTHIDTGHPALRAQLVICRDGEGREIRFKLPVPVLAAPASDRTS